ncbi:MAG: hypothetical protein QOD96_3143, partial [Pseudonocardiales bacterium]|nr:hypothetical protein [Pseudonocardiales bacterium]
MRGLLAGLADLVLPAGCAGCGAAGPPWCARCGAGVGPPGTVVGVAGTDCATVAVGAYSGPLRAALLAYKERGRRELAAPLGALLAAALLTAPGAPLLGGPC